MTILWEEGEVCLPRFVSVAVASTWHQWWYNSIRITDPPAHGLVYFRLEGRLRAMRP